MMPRPTIYYNDNDPLVCAWVRQLMFDGLIPYGVVDSRSILDVKPADLEGFTQCHFFCGIAGWAQALKLAGWPATRPVWTGSPPCQPFSAAGKLEGKDDARHLAPHFISLVGACRPPVLFGEQVASAKVFGKSAKRVRGAPEWAWFDDLSDRLEAAHYAVGASDIPAAGVGALHIRQRTFFGAVRLDYPASTRPIAKGQRSEAEARDKTRLRGLERGCGPERLADADGRHTCTEGKQCGGEQRFEPQDGVPERLADADKPGPQGRQGMPQRTVERAAGAGSLADGQSPSGTHHSGWNDVDWLFCRDGKWRPVKSSVQRVADGIPGGMVQGGDFLSASQPLAQSTKAARRVMRLRGYGNAIVPQAAALFINAFDTSVNKWQ
jgi:DNA (cytosine-5)-methyltransferase 1